MHRPTLTLLLAGALAAAVVPAQAENKVSFGVLSYQERDGRIGVTDGALAIEHDIDTDYSVKLDLGYDAISGATPAWRLKPGYANEYQKGLVPVAREKRRSAAASLLMRDAARNEYTFGASHSRETDFQSSEVSAQALLWEDDSHNRSYTVGLGLMHNTAVATAYTNNRQDETANTVNVQAGVTQVLDDRSTLEASVYGASESGYLSNHYLKIVRTDAVTGAHVLANDQRPDQRRSGGVALRYTRSLLPGLVGSAWYRWYRDDWSVTGHTLEARVHWDVNEQWRLIPVARVHRQSAASFYRAYGAAVNTFAATGNGSNDDRLGAMTARTLQLNVQYTASKEWSFHAGAGGYRQDNGFSSRTVTAGLIYKY